MQRKPPERPRQATTDLREDRFNLQVDGQGVGEMKTAPVNRCFSCSNPCTFTVASTVRVSMGAYALRSKLQGSIAPGASSIRLRLHTAT